MRNGSPWAAAVLTAISLVVAGCGTSSSSSGAASKPAALGGPQATELSYIAPGAPLIVTLSTGPHSPAIQGLQNLLGQVPVAAFGESALKTKLATIGINYDSDIKPLLGNPVMVGAGAADLTGADKSDVVLVWVTQSASALTALVKKVPGVQSIGSYDGATLYGEHSAVVAVDGATVVGGEEADVKAALDRHAHAGGSFSATEYARLLSGLPSSALLSVAGDLTQVLSTAKAAKARKVPWVGALSGYGVTLTGSSTGISLNYRLDTSGASLTSAEVPIGTADVVPSFAGSLPITFGLSDPAHVWTFAEASEQATNPAEWAKYIARQAKLKAKTGYDLDSLLTLLDGNLIVGSDTHNTIGRVGVSDPAQAAKILAALATDPTDVLKVKLAVRSVGGGLYSVAEGAGPTVIVGVIGNQLVAGRTSVAALRAFATAPATKAAGAHGSFAFRIALAELLTLTGHSSPVLTTILGNLGAFTGSGDATTSALSGNATLGLKSGG